MLKDAPRAVIERRRRFAPKSPHLDVEELKRQYLALGKSAKQIARKIGCSHSTVLDHLKEEGIEIQQTSSSYRKGQVAYGLKISAGREVRAKQKAEVISRMATMREQGYSYHKIAETLNVTQTPAKNKNARWHGTTVMNILKNHQSYPSLEETKE